MKKMIGIVIVLAAVLGTYFFIGSQLSGLQKRRMLTTVDSMERSGSERQEVRRLIEAVDEAALEAALARSTATGEETLMQAYAAEVFQRIIARSDRAGNAELAEKLTREQGLLTF